MSEQHKSTIRQWVEEFWNQGNVSLIDEIMAADYALYDAGDPVEGRDGFRQFSSQYRTAIPDLKVTIEDLIAEGDKVVWRYLAQGTHGGALAGVAATGKPVSPGIVISRFADGKWVEDWQNNDLLGLPQQIGAVPASGVGLGPSHGQYWSRLSPTTPTSPRIDSL